MYGNEWMAGHGFFMPWFFLLPLIIVLVFFAMRYSPCKYQAKNKEDEALEIARKRFAKGEIDEEAFDKIKQKLS